MQALAVVFARDIGLVGVAYAYLAANGLTFVINWFIAIRLLRMRPAQPIAAVVRPAVASVLMYIAVTELQESIQSVALVPQLLLTILVGSLVFIATVLILWLVAGRPTGAETIAIGYAQKIPVIGRLANRMLPAS